MGSLDVHPTGAVPYRPMSEDIFEAGANGQKPSNFPTLPPDQDGRAESVNIPDDFLGNIETGGAAVAYMRELRHEHICFRCKNLFLVEEVIQTSGDVGQVMREKQGTCLVVGNDVTNETRLKCSHFQRRWGLFGYLTDALKAIRG